MTAPEQEENIVQHYVPGPVITVRDFVLQSPEYIAVSTFFNSHERSVRIWWAIIVCACVIPFIRTIALTVFVITGLLMCPWTFYKLIPAAWRARCSKTLEARLPAVSAFYRWTHKNLEGVKPFFLCGLYLASAPIFPLVWLGHTVARALKLDEKMEQLELPAGDYLLLSPQKDKAEVTESRAFYLSPAFTVTTALLAVLGLPAGIAYALYNMLGIDALLGFPSKDPHFFVVFCIIGLYIGSIGWCLMPLMLRAFFTFPLNFISTRQDFVITEESIERKAMKGWFTAAACFSSYSAFSVKVDWREVEKVQAGCSGLGRLSPLPDNLLPRSSAPYKVLNFIAEAFDAIVDKIGRREFIAFHKPGDSYILQLPLDGISKEDRARLFYSLRKWAPSLYLNDQVQEFLVGSKVLNEPRYTQIWFDLLGDKSGRKRDGTLSAGETLRQNQLTIEKQLDSGGQANVYLARTASQDQVVIKEFILPCDDDLGMLIDSAQDFDNECSILTRLSHPNIVKLVDFFTEDRRVYLVLEYVEGKSLRQVVMQEGAMGEEMVIDLARQVCDILTVLHGADPPVVHRDITPDNLILTGNGQLKLIDFSVASGGTHDTAGDCVGKHSYTPPEQFRGAASAQSDIYALGATLHFLLTGKDPVPISKSSARESSAAVSEALSRIVETATELELDKRYQSAEWLKLDLVKIDRQTIKLDTVGELLDA